LVVGSTDQLKHSHSVELCWLWLQVWGSQKNPETVSIAEPLQNWHHPQNP